MGTATKAQKIGYSAGSLAAAVSYQAFSTYIIFYYVDVLAVSARLVGLGMVLFSVWNAVNDPLLGQLSDRTRTRWGRRIPYVALGAIPFALVFWLLWVPPFRAEAGQLTALYTYFLAVILVFDGLFTVVALNWTALFPEMFPTLTERAEVSAWRQMFSILGLIVGIALPPLIYGSLGWSAMGLLLAMLTLAGLAAAVWASRERPEFVLDPPLPFAQALRETLRNRAFLAFLGASLFIQLCFVMLTASVPFYARYVLRIGDAETSLLLGAAFIVALPMVFVWSRVAVRVGPRVATMLAIGAFGVALIPFWVARTLLHGILATSLLGIGLAGLIMLTELLIADVIDEDEVRTGVRREGIYFGINGFAIRLGISIQALVISGVLEWTGYQPGLAAQPATAIWGIRFLMGGVPLLALLLALASVWAYPLHGPRLEQMKRGLEALHGAKAARLAAGQPGASPAQASRG